MFKYSSKWAYIKFFASAICFIWLIVMIVDGYFGQNVNVSSKGWNFVLFILLGISGALLIWSGLKELKNEAPLQKVKIVWLFTILIAFYETFVSVFRLVEADNRNLFDAIGVLFVIVFIVLIRELWILRLYNKRQDSCSKYNSNIVR